MVLKTNFATPIFKSGDQGAPENCRPVALTSQVKKVFEKTLRRRLVAFLEKNLINYLILPNMDLDLGGLALVNSLPIPRGFYCSLKMVKTLT